MEFSYDRWNQLEDIELILCNPNKQKIGVISAVERKVTLRLNDLAELTFDVPRYAANARGEVVDSPYYDWVQTMRLIFADQIGWFVITKVEEKDAEDGSITKSVTCESHQAIFKNFGFVTEERVYKFYDPALPFDTEYDSFNIEQIPSVVGQLNYQLGIFIDVDNNHPSVDTDNGEDYGDWTITYITPQLWYYDTDATPGTLKYEPDDLANWEVICRTLSDNTTNGYDFMVNDVEDAFEIVVCFDYLRHTIKFKTADEITKKTNIYLSKDNILSSLDVTEESNDIATVLSCEGDSLDITLVNPMGTNYIVNFDYYMQTATDDNGHTYYPWMSYNLQEAINNWKIVYEANKEPYKNLVTELKDLYEEQLYREERLVYLKTKLSDVQAVLDQVNDSESGVKGYEIFTAEEVSSCTHKTAGVYREEYSLYPKSMYFSRPFFSDIRDDDGKYLGETTKDDEWVFYSEAEDDFDDGDDEDEEDADAEEEDDTPSNTASSGITYSDTVYTTDNFWLPHALQATGDDKGDYDKSSKKTTFKIYAGINSWSLESPLTKKMRVTVEVKYKRTDGSKYYKTDVDVVFDEGDEPGTKRYTLLTVDKKCKIRHKVNGELRMEIKNAVKDNYGEVSPLEGEDEASPASLLNVKPYLTTDEDGGAETEGEEESKDDEEIEETAEARKRFTLTGDPKRMKFSETTNPSTGEIEYPYFIDCNQYELYRELSVDVEDTGYFLNPSDPSIQDEYDLEIHGLDDKALWANGNLIADTCKITVTRKGEDTSTAVVAKVQYAYKGTDKTRRIKTSQVIILPGEMSGSVEREWNAFVERDIYEDEDITYIANVISSIKEYKYNEIEVPEDPTATPEEDDEGSEGDDAYGINEGDTYCQLYSEVQSVDEAEVDESDYDVTWSFSPQYELDSEGNETDVQATTEFPNGEIGYLYKMTARVFQCKKDSDGKAAEPHEIETDPEKFPIYDLLFVFRCAVNEYTYDASEGIKSYSRPYKENVVMEAYDSTREDDDEYDYKPQAEITITGITEIKGVEPTIDTTIAGYEDGYAYLDTVTTVVYQLAGFTRYAAYEDAFYWVGLYNAEISKVQTEYDDVNEVIDCVTEQLGEIAEETAILSYFKQNCNYLIPELTAYWKESTYTNDNLAVLDTTTMAEQIDLANQLMEAGEEELSLVAQPRFSFTAEGINFIFLPEFKPFAKEVEMGCVVTVEKEEGVFYYPALSEVQFSLDDFSSFSMTFTNRARLDDFGYTIADLISSSSSTSNTINNNWSNLMKYVNQEDEIKNIITNPLSETFALAKNNAANQEFCMTDSGFWGRKLKNKDIPGEYYDEQVRMTNNILMFTDDYWKSIKTALGKVSVDGEEYYGLIAEAVVGDLIFGQQLHIVNADKSISLDSNGLTIYNKSSNDDSTYKSFYIDDDGNLVVAGADLKESTIDVLYDVNGSEVYSNGQFYGDLVDQNGNIIISTGECLINLYAYDPEKSLDEDGKLTLVLVYSCGRFYNLYESDVGYDKDNNYQGTKIFDEDGIYVYRTLCDTTGTRIYSKGFVYNLWGMTEDNELVAVVDGEGNNVYEGYSGDLYDASGNLIYSVLERSNDIKIEKFYNLYIDLNEGKENTEPEFVTAFDENGRYVYEALYAPDGSCVYDSGNLYNVYDINGNAVFAGGSVMGNLYDSYGNLTYSGGVFVGDIYTRDGDKIYSDGDYYGDHYVSCIALDDHGLTILNSGGIRIYKEAGDNGATIQYDDKGNVLVNNEVATPVFWADEDGNLRLTGEITAMTGDTYEDKFVTIDTKGLTIANCGGIQIYNGVVDDNHKVFYGDNSGNLYLKGIVYASDGEFTGTITAKSGNIAGFEIQSGFRGDDVSGLYGFTVALSSSSQEGYFYVVIEHSSSLAEDVEVSYIVTFKSSDDDDLTYSKKYSQSYGKNTGRASYNTKFPDGFDTATDITLLSVSSTTAGEETSYLSYTKKFYDDGNDGVYLGVDGIGLGAVNTSMTADDDSKYSTSGFFVTNEGALWARNGTFENATITGTGVLNTLKIEDSLSAFNGLNIFDNDGNSCDITIGKKNEDLLDEDDNKLALWAKVTCQEVKDYQFKCVVTIYSDSECTIKHTIPEDRTFSVGFTSQNKKKEGSASVTVKADTNSGSTDTIKTKDIWSAGYRIPLNEDMYFSGTNPATNVISITGEPCLMFNCSLLPADTATFSLGAENYGWYEVVTKTAKAASLNVSGLSYCDDGVWCASDARLKEDIAALSSNYSDFFDKLSPVRFKRTDGTSNRYHTGLIAQDVLSSLKDSGLTSDDFAAYIEGDNGLCGLRYDEFIALLVKEVQELKKKVANLENEVELAG